MSLIFVLRYLDLLRVPILVSLILFLLPCLAVFTSARSLLAGLFDLTPRGFYLVNVAALAVSWTVLFTARQILFTAHHRFPDLAAAQVELPGTLPLWAAVFGLLALPVVLASLRISPRGSRGRMLLAGGLALATMTGVLAGGWRLYLAWQSPLTAKAGKLLASLDAPAVLGGYLNDDLKEHLTAAAAFTVALALYAALGLASRWRLVGTTAPALTSILQLLVLVCWGFSGLTFFFDAFRVPLLLVIAAAFVITAQSPNSDHYYRVRALPGPRPVPPTPAETLLAGGRERVIVVAANGGGIQAAAWTARVLTGLAEDLGPEFSRSVRMISAVSGGSVGAMYFVDAYGRADGFAGVLEDAMTSSLDEIAWGLVYPDLWRLVCPPLGRMAAGPLGRGRALEESWENRDAGLTEPLTSWQEEVRRGERPGVVFNATLSEMGFRLLFSTAPLDPFKGLKESHTARLNFEELYPDGDLAISTAVRLSATFPYVTPAARADVPGRQPHVVDGGYYDNFGMSTLVEWLDAALRQASPRVKQVLVLQIRGARTREATAATAREVSSRGWFYQAFAPLATMLKVWGAAQVSHNEAEYGLLQRSWAGKVDLHSVVLEFPAEHPPLSWHLTSGQKKAILQAWNTPAVRACRDQVRDFLR
jgi:hypothetical protein